MRSGLFGFLLLCLLPGCKQMVEPNDSLYRTWRLTQIQYNDGRTVTVMTGEWAIVTFQPNGMILYGTTGRYAACCSPDRFRRKGNTLDFIDVKSIPLPPTPDNAEKCYLVDCQSIDSSSEILTLNDSTLVLKANLGIYAYLPYR